MSVKIKLKHSSTAGKVPTAGDLDAGEVALNTSDVKAYIKNAGGAVVQLAGSGADATKVDKAGDTMTGALVLPAAAPTTDAEAANKKYVDDQIVAGNLWSRAGTVVSPKTAGDDVTTTGDVSAADITATGTVNAASVVATGDVQAISYNGGPLAGLRNQLIGNCLVWQRGSSGGPTTSGGAYAADHAFLSIGVTWTRAPSSTFAPGIEYGLRFSGGTNCYVVFPVELLRVGKPNQFSSGTTWTLSYYADKASDHKASVYFSDTAVPTNEVSLVAAKAPVALGGNRYSVTFTVGSAPNATNVCLSARVINTTGSTLELAGPQLEPGPVATPFEHRPIGLELSLCQRFYQVRSTGTVNAADLRPTMRATPTIVSSAYDAEL